VNSLHKKWARALAPPRAGAYIAGRFEDLALGHTECQSAGERPAGPQGPGAAAAVGLITESAAIRGENAATGGAESMKIRPLQDRIIVKRIDEEEKTKGGIIIPDTAKEKPQEAKVIAVGKGKVKEDGTVLPLDVKKGDRVLFSKYSGTEITIDGEEHLIIREDDVLGVCE
jgi:chaperonin GroES